MPKKKANEQRWQDSPCDDKEARKRLLADTYTVTSRKSTEARVAWWVSRATLRSMAPFPLTAEKLQLAAAILKRGRYRSASQYLYSMKQEHCNRGHEWPQHWTMLLAGLRRSCARGLGGTKQAPPLSLGAAGLLGAYKSELVDRAEAVIHVGCGWLLREIELASLKGGDVKFVTGAGCGTAVVTLGATKTDTEAVGAARAMCCICPEPACPVKATKVLADGKGPGDCLVLKKDGTQATKANVVAALKEYGAYLGDAPERVTGHSMRVTGAQRMAGAGVQPEVIKAFGRWGSSQQMARYAREALANPRVIASAVKAAGQNTVGSEASLSNENRVTKVGKWTQLRARSASGRGR